MIAFPRYKRPFRVAITPDESWGWFVRVDDGSQQWPSVAFCFTLWGAQWKAARVLKRLQVLADQEILVAGGSDDRV